MDAMHLATALASVLEQRDGVDDAEGTPLPPGPAPVVAAEGVSSAAPAEEDPEARKERRRLRKQQKLLLLQQQQQQQQSSVQPAAGFV